eukprot:scaffold38025_cov69-Phaeocystis_antarctica.AAC.1
MPTRRSTPEASPSGASGPPSSRTSSRATVASARWLSRFCSIAIMLRSTFSGTSPSSPHASSAASMASSTRCLSDVIEATLELEACLLSIKHISRSAIASSSLHTSAFHRRSRWLLATQFFIRSITSHAVGLHTPAHSASTGTPSMNSG